GIILLTMINDKMKNRKALFLLIFGFIFLFLIFINGSRAGLLSFVLGFSCIFIENLKVQNYRIKMEKFLLFHAAATIIVISCIVYFNKISNLFFNKWNGSSDISSGREFMWQETIKDANFFGHGSNYFYQKFFIGDAHNIFVQVLGQYGMIPLLLFVLMIVYLVILLVKLKDTNYYAIFLSYLTLGLFENVLFINFRFGTITFIIWVFIGLLLDKDYEGTGADTK
ncbi:O-antigen ligase, partial [Paenibacillus sp. P32E]|uniref:O-antigen ligase family protein n=1 Tax=Paenibacillus sp. P32E TaxID=1349434 RepID=UPI0011610689